MPRLEYLLTFRADLKPPVEVGAVPGGSRRIFDILGGSFEGPRLKGKLLPGGGDWLLIGADGVGRLDVRGTFESDDGAHIYVQYHGVLTFNEAVVAALGSGEEMAYGASYFMTAPPLRDRRCALRVAQPRRHRGSGARVARSRRVPGLRGLERLRAPAPGPPLSRHRPTGSGRRRPDSFATTVPRP